MSLKSYGREGLIIGRREKRRHHIVYNIVSRNQDRYSYSITVSYCRDGLVKPELKTTIKKTNLVPLSPVDRI